MSELHSTILPGGKESTICVPLDWSGRSGSNRRHSAWEADVLPLNYARNAFDLQELGWKVQAQLAGHPGNVGTTQELGSRNRTGIKAAMLSRLTRLLLQKANVVEVQGDTSGLADSERSCLDRPSQPKGAAINTAEDLSDRV